jgi:hypothetical protein
MEFLFGQIPGFPFPGVTDRHGPWLQPSPEVLKSLAYSNFYSPRPVN